MGDFSIWFDASRYTPFGEIFVLVDGDGWETVEVAYFGNERRYTGDSEELENRRWRYKDGRPLERIVTQWMHLPNRLK